MEMRHGLPVWAPDDPELAAISKRVSHERSKAVKEAVGQARELFVNEHEVVGRHRQ